MLPPWQLLDVARHAEALEHLSLEALAEENLAVAFACADRRCRIAPAAQAHHYVLRAEISYRMGDRDFAISDLQRALALDPLDISANRRLLAWGNKLLRYTAARALIADDSDFSVVAKALKALSGNRHHKAFGSLICLDTVILGWAAWRGDRAVELNIRSEDGHVAISLSADRSHPLAAALGSATSIEVERPRSLRHQAIQLSLDRITFHTCWASPNGTHNDWASRDHLRVVDTELSDKITIIVPVYGDYIATRRCLQELRQQLTENQRAIVIDDASPDQRIRDLVRAVAEDPRIDCLVNAENIGFVGSVNRALHRVDSGDVLLLNADTTLPPRLAMRLAAVARSASDIGTVTPLSNNGEFTSFPRANEANPVGTIAQVLALDRTAAKVNGDAVVDIPNGIGFCLYITRQCLNAVGHLSEMLHRGYLEDVDFCLRARQQGFRNVCAPGIYVGHAGSRSFGKQKRPLVLRNLHAIESRYPFYREECASFLLADPIRRYREAIERAEPIRTHRRLRLLISAPGIIESIADVRAQQLAEAGNSVLILRLRIGASGLVARLRDASGGVPQSVNFQIERPNERKALMAYIEAASPELIEFIDLTGMPISFLETISGLGIAYDVLVAGGGIVCNRGTLLRQNGAVCTAISTGKKCAECDRPGLPRQLQSDEADERRGFVNNARKIVALSAHSNAFATRLLPKRYVEECVPPLAVRQSAPDGLACGKAIGIISIAATATEHKLTLGVARLLRRERPAVAVVVLGKILNDIGLMKVGNVFVSGPVSCEDFARASRQYRIGALFLPLRQPLFGHPLLGAAQSCALPLAYFDWSFGAVPSRHQDLALDPGVDNDAVARRIVDWYGD